ncbi:MAG TPA: type II secretion system protein [Candidatus Paceibacterota bacterium]|jgi:prepilin-type N-terminal cleavage/methylation domain-containing protein|nr:type II secretion system protein [Candidatus Paceibacterota bacterium]
MNRTKGFTLIELLVVIAIIGILSSVVLASLNTARGKGSDAAIKSQLASIRPQAEIYYDTNGNYGAAAAAANAAQCTVSGTFFQADTTARNQIAGVQNSAGSANVICSTNANPATAWAIAARLVSNTGLAWCVDSTGASKQYTGTPAAAITSSACN